MQFIKFPVSCHYGEQLEIGCKCICIHACANHEMTTKKTCLTPRSSWHKLAQHDTVKSSTYARSMGRARQAGKIAPGAKSR